MGRVNQEIPDEIHRWLKAKAALLGIPLKELVVRLLEEAKRKDKS